MKYCYSSTSKLPLSTSNSSRLRAGSTLNHARKYRKAKRSSGKESREEVPLSGFARCFAALDFTLAATPRVLLLHREPARRLILEMSSALEVWDATKTIHVEQLTSLTPCLYYYFRKQSVQNRGKKLNRKRSAGGPLQLGSRDQIFPRTFLCYGL